MRVLTKKVSNILMTLPPRTKAMFSELWAAEYESFFGVQLYLYTRGYSLRRDDGVYVLQEFFKAEDYKAFMDPIFEDLLRQICVCLRRVNKARKLQMK